MDSIDSWTDYRNVKTSEPVLARGPGNHPRLLMLPTSTGSCGTLAADEFNGPLQLAINSGPSFMPIELSRLVGRDGGSFKSPAFPCVVGSGRQRQPEPVAHFY